jgi:uncharacterized protein YggU (UPF0235/DUF167 family)
MITKRVKVKPGASKNELIIDEGNNWIIKLRAKPIDGEANVALVEFLSEKLKISKSRITIQKGLTSTFKTLVIEGDLNEEVL